MSLLPVRLLEVLDLVVTEADIAEYKPVRYAVAPPLAYFPGGPATQYELDHRRCRAVQDRLWTRVLPHLLSRRWIAYGLAKGALEPVRISVQLWPHLYCSFAYDEVFSPDVSDIHFYAVTIVPTATNEGMIPHADVASLRLKLIHWIEEQAAAGRGPVRKSELFEEAAQAFTGHKVSKNLFAEAWRAARKPRNFLHSGRPKA